MTKLDFQTKIQYLPGVGPKSAAKFLKLGLLTISDLVYDFPRRYEDYTHITPISKLADEISNSEFLISNQLLNNNTQTQNGGTYTIKGTMLGIANKTTRRRGFTVTEAVVADATGSLKVVWFNQPFLTKMLRAGNQIILNGKISYDQFSGGYAMESPVRVDKQKIAPVYSVTAGVSSFYIAKLVHVILPIVDDIAEYLPAEILQKYHLMGIAETLRNIHEPKDGAALSEARKRLAFDELFFISLKSNLSKEELAKQTAPAIVASPADIKAAKELLPFKLTGDQSKAIAEITADLSQERPMSRLLNGDVGSGKTAVAAVAAYLVKQAGFKTLIMAPTSILAVQHYETFKKLFGEKMSIGLKTSDRQEFSNLEPACRTGRFKISYPPTGEAGQFSNPNLKIKKLEIENCDIVVGTQALIQKGVNFDKVGLVVVDEQHRFGVKQRAALQEQVTGNKEQAKGLKSIYPSLVPHPYVPHFLSMTATPIPRTLHLALFGDLDLSLIKEMPANRREIKTRLVEPGNRAKAYDFIREHIKMGRQAFIICPLIEGNGEQGTGNSLFEEDRKSVVSEFEKLKSIFPEFNIAMLHGKMPAKQKDAVMADFASGLAQLLVSTSVVEVGIDVPNAVVMMIEDAERFGLAQLHQFRGRVGRAEFQSFCFLFSNSKSDKAMTRLRAMEETNDGFKLAEIDLETRGPGAIFGLDQSGVVDLKMASYSDYNLIKMASEAAKETVAKIKTLPLLREKLDNFLVTKHLE